jgi:hypothetical protein
MRLKSRRSGYAMMLVIVFIAIVNLFFALSYKHLSSALRVQTANRDVREIHEGNVVALAAGLTLLEVGNVPSTLSQYQGNKGFLYDMTIGDTAYLIQLTPNPGIPPAPQAGDTYQWTVVARPKIDTDPVMSSRDIKTAIQNAVDALKAS